MARCHTQLEVPQAGNGKEAIASWSKAGPRSGRRGPDHKVRQEAKKMRKSVFAAKKAVKKVGGSSKRVESGLDVGT